jgi:pilus assembly protein CpaE
MQQQVRQLALITEIPYRAEVIEHLTAGRGWHLLPVVGHPNPVEALREQPVEVVLVDLDRPDAIALFSELANTLSTTPLLALTTPQRLTDLQEAQLAGATDFVAFPINHQHFFATIDRVRQGKAGSLKAGRLIAFVSLKGGVGRSTLAVNLAVVLAQRHPASVIVAEAHHGLGQLALLLNLQPRHTVANLASEANIDLDLVRGYLQPHQSGIRVLAAPAEPAQLVELGEETWQRTLSLLTELAPFVVVDTAALADTVLSQVLVHATDIVVMIDPTIASLYSARALLETLRKEEGVHAQLHVVLNQAEISGGLNASTVQKHLGKAVDASIPSDPPLATFAFNRGVPFVVSNPRALISRKVQQLADQLVKPGVERQKAAPRRMPALFSLLGLLR